MTTYEWTRTLPVNTSKTDHYRSFESMILSITEDVSTDITCVIPHGLTPVLMFFENLTRNRDIPLEGKYLFGTEGKISFYVDPERTENVATIEANGMLIAQIEVIQHWVD